MIAEAETALVKEDFTASLVIYKKAFSSYPFKFAYDIYHAIQVAAILKSERDCADLLDTCLAYGIQVECLKETALIQTYLRTIPGDQLIKKVHFYDEIYRSKIDTALQHEWRDRYKCEQSAKKKYDYHAFFLKCLKDNYTALKKYITTNNQYPGEKIMGLCRGFKMPSNPVYGKDSSRAEANKIPVFDEPGFSNTEEDEECDLGNNFVTPTLLHTGISFAELKKYLDMSLENGSLNPRDYMYFLEFEKGTGKRQIGFTKYYSDHQENLDFSCYSLCFNMGWGGGCQNNAFANECRKKIGVCSVETDLQKNEIRKKYGFVFLNIM